MKYSSLLLNCGGGIINPHVRSPQFSQSAALCIGIGGTGVAALCDLKGKIYQQLEPDNPDDPIPRYDGIQLLAIDSDDTMAKQFEGNRRLSEGEYFSIKVDNLAALIGTPKGKALIKSDPLMDWMEIDKIDQLLSPLGAGGIRQIGRYLLMKRASDLCTEIQNKCRAALEKRNSSYLDIYIFAGISGGTGSGCFLDVCYLVRKVVADNAWNANIMGYFFLPDVVTSKKDVASKPPIVSYNNSNGYAAMKELDFLMNMKSNHEEFQQSYGAGISVKTDTPPVDMCHLISAQQSNGKPIPNGFGYGVNVASDYVMAYLAEVDIADNEDVGESLMTIRGHLANVTRGVLGIPRRWGANLSYHILGASNAEIPITQINTYLAAGFFQKFAQKTTIPKATVTKKIVKELLTSMQANSSAVYASVTDKLQALHLPSVEPRELAKTPLCGTNKLYPTWGNYYNNFWGECAGTMTTNIQGLTKDLDSYKYDKANKQSLIGRLFQRLWDLSKNPQYGPYYAAYLIKNNGEDLLATLNGMIDEAEKKAEANAIQVPELQRMAIDYQQALIDSRGKRRDYVNYLTCVEDWLNYEMQADRCTKTAEVLRKFRQQAEELHDGFFRPLCDLLDNLQETFKENAEYLGTPEAAQVNAYTWQILKLKNIQPRLDATIAQLTDTQLVDRFVSDLLVHSDAWLSSDENKITRQISQHMLELFASETNRSLESYLSDMFPKAVGAGQLADAIEQNILNVVHKRAVPMFWSDPTYPIDDGSYIFESSSLSVPRTCSAVCSAAISFRNNHQTYAVRQTGIGDRIFALRFISGIPLFAYHGISSLKEYYDKADPKAQVGSHLYAATDRGSSTIDWRTYLPTPMPYSKDPELNPNGAEVVALYKEAVDRGVITLARGGNNSEKYILVVMPEPEVKDYRLEEFISRDKFNAARYNAEVDKIQTQLDGLRDAAREGNVTCIELQNDGNLDVCNDREAVRTDYIALSPVLQEKIRCEIGKEKRLQAAKKQLEEIKAEYDSYTQDLREFVELLLAGVLECRDVSDNANYVKTETVRYRYKDRYQKDQTLCLTIKTQETALYSAFEAYRKKNSGDPLVWVKIANELDRLSKKAVKQEDCYIAAILEQVWDTRALENLQSDTLRGKDDKDQKPVLRFYNGLCRLIQERKTRLSEWPDGTLEELIKAWKQLTAPGPEPVKELREVPEKVIVWYNGQYLEIYPKQYLQYAYNTATGIWVKLNASMFQWNAVTGGWYPIKLDANGNFTL